MRLLLFFLLFNNWCNCQTYTYQVYFKNQCTGEIKEGESFSLKKDKQTYCSKDIFNKSLSVKDTGVYTLHLSALRYSYSGNDSLKVHIKSGKNIDTLNLPFIKEHVCVCTPPPTNYITCGDSVMGVQEDYYFNGKLRAKGTFENGYLTDTLFEYDRNGVIRKLTIPVKLKGEIKKGFIVYSYYPNGNLERYYNNKKKIIQEFYPNGNLKSEDKFSKFSSYRKEYNENGKLAKLDNKKWTIYYNEDGETTSKEKKEKWHKYGY